MADKRQLKEIERKLSEISIDVARGQLDLRFTFVPINLDALKIALGGKLVFDTKEVANDIATLLEEADAPLPQDVEDWIRRDAKGNAQKENRLRREALEARVRKLSETIFSFEDFRDRLIRFMLTNHTSRIEVIGGRFYHNGVGPLLEDDLKKLKTCVVYEGNEVIGGLYTSFSAAAKGLFTPFINKELARLLDQKIYEPTNFTQGFDIGHILGAPGSKISQTALGQKVKNIYDAIDNLFNTNEITATQAGGIKAKVGAIFTQLQNASTYGPRIEATLTQSVKDALVSVGGLIVIIQDRKENQLEYGNKLEGVAGRLLANLFASLGFSRSLKQNIQLQIKENLQFGKLKTKGITKSVKIVMPSKKVVSKPRVTTSIQNITGSIKIPKKPLPKPKQAVQADLPYARPDDLKINDSLGGLQNIINAALPQKLRQNMGNGSSKDVLNYRTGRFSENVEVQRLTRSRSGMITAYYDYMRYPYATFSEGGQQQYPRSRDPKLLISKSIREIMQEQMITRMRAVLV